MAWKTITLFGTLLLAGSLPGQSSTTPPTAPKSPGDLVPQTHTECPLTVSEPLMGQVPADPGLYWASAEYLYWWMRGDQIPALITSGSTATPLTQVGVLGVPGTTVLFGDDRINSDARCGVRLSAGMWLDSCRTLGIGIEGFALQELDEGINASSTGLPPLARPVFNTLTGLPDAQLASFSGVAQSTLTASSESNICGASIYARKALCCCCGESLAIDGLMGFRYLYLKEELTLGETLTSIDPTLGAPPIGTVFTLTDSFRTQNQFYGADVGFAAIWTCGRYFIDVLGKIAIGCNRRDYTVGGSTTNVVPGLPPSTAQGGLYTQGQNGTFSDQVFSLIPELRLNVGCRLTDCVRVFGGYSVMCWTNVARPGEQINTNVNPAELPPALVPITPRTPGINDSTLWLHGLNVGVAVSF